MRRILNTMTSKVVELRFLKKLDFIEKSDKSVLISCNQGISRSPSVAMLYLAKRDKVVNGENLDEAEGDFLKLYNQYNPGVGIKIFLKQNWEKIQ